MSEADWAASLRVFWADSRTLPPCLEASLEPLLAVSDSFWVEDLSPSTGKVSRVA